MEEFFTKSLHSAPFFRRTAEQQMLLHFFYLRGGNVRDMTSCGSTGNSTPMGSQHTTDRAREHEQKSVRINLNCAVSGEESGESEDNRGDVKKRKSLSAEWLERRRRRRKKGTKGRRNEKVNDRLLLSIQAKHPFTESLSPCVCEKKWGTKRERRRVKEGTIKRTKKRKLGLVQVWHSRTKQTKPGW